MVLRRRKPPRALQDLPGLFDDIDSKYSAPASRPASHPDGASDLQPVAKDADRLPHRAIMQFISFGSGSSGNCAYLGIPGQGGILIDAGVDAKKVLEGMRRNCIDADKVSAIILTHDHGDHIHFAYPLLRKLPGAALCCTPRTLAGIFTRHRVSKRLKDYHRPIYKEFAFDAGPFTITPFETSHDGSDNVGFCISAGINNFVVTTDTGCITERADHYMRLANYLMIEANYDSDMLTAGTYPEHLKYRIRGDKGHLDNAVTAQYLAQMWQPRLTDIFLCHLSHDNNRPEIAQRVVADALRDRQITVGDGSGSITSRKAMVQLSVLPRFDASPLHIFRLD